VKGSSEIEDALGVLGTGYSTLTKGATISDCLNVVVDLLNSIAAAQKQCVD
jgi:hypothetical protein